MRNRLKRLAALVAVATLFTAAVASAAETGVTRLVFEKSTKMKKIKTTLYLSFSAGESSALRCGVVARGNSGAIPAAGAFSLRLIGESAGGGEVWESDAVSSSLDDNGDAWFEAEEISGLADEAPGGTEIRLVQVGFKGGRGGKATEVTIDCLREESGS